MHYEVKTYGGVGAKLHAFLTSAVEVSGSFTFRPLHLLGTSPQYLLGRILRG
jgi:hypothetical protein